MVPFRSRKGGHSAISPGLRTDATGGAGGGERRGPARPRRHHHDGGQRRGRPGPGEPRRRPTWCWWTPRRCGPDTVGFTRRVLERSPGAVVVFFGRRIRRSPGAAVAAGARGLIRGGEREDLVASVAKALMLLLRSATAGVPTPARPRSGRRGRPQRPRRRRTGDARPARRTRTSRRRRERPVRRRRGRRGPTTPSRPPVAAAPGDAAVGRRPAARADRAGAAGAAGHGGRQEQRRDRPGAVRLRGHRQDPRPAAVPQARAPGTGPTPWPRLSGPAWSASGGTASADLGRASDAAEVYSSSSSSTRVSCTPSA